MKMEIAINQFLSGVLTLPPSMGTKVPAVLLLHGFGTDKNEVGNSFALASEKLAKDGLASLRIDFQGFGSSKENTIDLTIDRLIIDANAAFNFLMQHHAIDNARLGICGFSLGAGISILIANNQKVQIKSMGLLSPAGDLPKDFSDYLGSDQYNSLENAINELEIDLGWRKIKLKSKFINSLKQYSLMKSFKNYTGAFSVIAGKKDSSYKHALTYITKAKSTQKEILLLDNCDHIFNAFNADSSMIDLVTTEVTSWFKKTL